MYKYRGLELTEEEYYIQLFCNGLQRYKRKMSGKAEGRSLFHAWRDVGDSFREQCTKCGDVRFINTWVGKNEDNHESSKIRC